MKVDYTAESYIKHQKELVGRLEAHIKAFENYQGERSFAQELLNFIQNSIWDGFDPAYYYRKGYADAKKDFNID